jgi:hypothetical protein
MHKAAMITGGYVLQPRIIKNSEIAHAPPHVREIWFYLIREANHKTNNVCKRGELIRSYRDIQEALHWYVGWRKEKYKKHQCEIAMKWLTKRHMVATRKTTRGLRIKILQYNKYQDPKNYEKDRERQTTDTINKNEKNEKNVKKKEININDIENKPKTAEDILKNIDMRGRPKYLPQHWQNRAEHFSKKMSLNKSDTSVLFKYFKKNFYKSERLSGLIVESQELPDNPIAYFLKIYKQEK